MTHLDGLVGTAHPTPLISISNVSVRFPGVLALDRVSLDITAGELCAIVGENGAGKSTLMKVLAGVYSNFDGEILLRGRPQRFHSTKDAERAGVSIIYQELNLVEQLPVAANIFLGRERRGRFGLLDDRAMNVAAAGLLGELECRAAPTQLVGSLRVGDQQLVEIAKALSLQSDIVIMDEPTSALTEAESERLMRIIARLKARGVTVLYISHKMDEVFRLADRITVLRDGRVVETVRPSESSPRAVAHLMVVKSKTPVNSSRELQALPSLKRGASRSSGRAMRKNIGCATWAWRFMPAKCWGSPASWEPAEPNCSNACTAPAAFVRQARCWWAAGKWRSTIPHRLWRRAWPSSPKIANDLGSSVILPSARTSPSVICARRCERASLTPVPSAPWPPALLTDFASRPPASMLRSRTFRAAISRNASSDGDFSLARGCCCSTTPRAALTWERRPSCTGSLTVCAVRVWP
jgi:ABC-type branched-subunit amino acid transport system ATPase component